MLVSRLVVLSRGGFFRLLLVVLLLGYRGTAFAVSGQWSPEPTSPPVGFTQVHMVLLPGDLQDDDPHSRILMWSESGLTQGAELLWNPGTEGCNAFPYALSVLPGPWSPGVDIHCAGHSGLPNGELLSAGGEDFGQFWGIADSRTFQTGPGTTPGSWAAGPAMRQARFYPSVSTLADGRAAVTGGHRDEQAWFFGGRVNGIPPSSGVGDLLSRHARSAGGGWDLSVTPEATGSGERPTPREGHSAVYLQALNASVYFGGRNGAGSAVDQETWLLRREDGTTLAGDYTYRWDKLVTPDPKPATRSEHTATAIAVSATEMIVFGGTQTAGQEFWRLFYDTENQIWRWQIVTVNGPHPGPSARFGHAAVFQKAVALVNDNRMLVFGGSNSLGGTATDDKVYAFTFEGNDFSKGEWSDTVATGPAPGARRDHIMVLEDRDTAPEPNGPFLLVHGGHLGSGGEDGALWKLSLGALPTTTGTGPGPRANHTALYDMTVDGRLMIFGGEPAPTAGVDKFFYYLHPFFAVREWKRGGEATNQLSGHTGAIDPAGAMHARLTEIYNRSAGAGAGAGAWATQTNSGWLLPPNMSAFYPAQFVVPGGPFAGGGRLLRVGPDPIARYLDIPAAGQPTSWQTVPCGGNGPFHPHTGVLYEPGKILVVGDEVTPKDTAKTFDATAIGTACWVARPGVERARYLNLVILPNGSVLALGGLRASGAAQQCPQIWTPSTGLWTAVGDLACETAAVRDYHSTAMLLPDGRVMSGGGLASGSKLLVFCPPYLDTEAEWSTRPVITSCPTSITYGQSFVIGKQSGDSIVSACLIRPAATTHGFDQNQRFIPLTLTWESATALRTFAPSNGSIAPPGYYLLFTVNRYGVPAVAKWVRLANCPIVPCDQEPPPVVSNLYVDIVGPNEIWLAWPAPGDDRDPELGAYDMRFSTSPITTEKAFEMASPVGAPYPPPPPGPLGSGQSCAKDGLSPCTPYYFALKTHDGATNWSMKASLSASTSCDGGGGGFSARHVDEGAQGTWAVGSGSASQADGENGASAVSSTMSGLGPPAAPASLLPAPGVLVAETRRSASGGWEVAVKRVSEAEGFDPALVGAIVSQIHSEDGSWKTLGRHQPSAGQSPLGLCALRDQGRVVFPAGYELDGVVGSVREGGQDLALSLANHSRLGALGDAFLASGGSVEVSLGDVLDLTYTLAGRALPGAANWYLLARSGAEGSATPARRGLSPAVPSRFALHPNQPNPFRRSTSITFDLPVASTVTLEVFDLLGRKVATLAQGAYPAGLHVVEWDLHDASGGAVRPGVYVARLAAGEFRAQMKLGVLP